jgi:predicted acyltransferase
VLAGHWLGSNRSGARKAAGLTIAGLVCLITGYVWGLFFPIIKIIWTSSYVLYAGGWSLLLLALFYWLIDVKGYKKWAIFFVVIGMNPITIYFLQSFVSFDGIAEFFLVGISERAGLFKPLVLLFGVLMVKWLFLWFLYRRRIFFRI